VEGRIYYLWGRVKSFIDSNPILPENENNES
jgi:hypothetical protein